MKVGYWELGDRIVGFVGWVGWYFLWIGKDSTFVDGGIG